MADTIDVDINVNTETGELDILAKKIKEVKDEAGETIGIETDVDDSDVKTTKKEIDDMKGEKVDVDVDVDDSDIKNTKNEIEDLSKSATANINATGNAITGVISGLAGKSIWDTVYGTSAKAETNKVLIKNMGDTSKAYTDLYNTIDKTTDSSLISMQQLIPAMNGIKSATGATAAEIDNITPGVANFGQYVYAMTGSSARAEQAMFDLSKGIKGAYASLDQYGITEDALMRTGLWSGKEDDVEGYIAAVNECIGSTDDLMSTSTGLEAQLGKAYSRAGKNIGASVLPAVKSLLNGFLDLDAATGGWMSTVSLMGGGIASSVVGGLSAFSQAKMGYDGLKDSYNSLSDGLGKVKGKMLNLPSSIKSGFGGVKNTITNVGSAASKLGSSIGSGFGKVKNVFTGIGSTVGGLGSKLSNVGSKISGVSGTIGKLVKSEKLMTLASKASSAASTIRAGAEGALTAVKSASIGPTTGLAIAENSLLLPLLLIVGAIVAVVAVMWYLYNTNEGVRNAINGFADAVKGAGKWLMDSFGAACEWVQGALGNLGKAVDEAGKWIKGALENLWNYITSAGGLLPEQASITGNKIVDAAIGVVIFLMTLPAQIGMIFINLIAKALGFGDNFAQRMFQAGAKALMGIVRSLIALPGRVYNILLQVIAGITSWAANLVNRARTAATNFVNNLLNPIRALPGMIQSAVSSIANILFKPFQDAWNKIKPIIDSIKNAISTVTDWLGDDEGGVGYYSDNEGVPSINKNLNTTLSSMASNSTSSSSTSVNNNFYGLVEESAADYIIQAVNDRLRKEKIIKGV